MACAVTSVIVYTAVGMHDGVVCVIGVGYVVIIVCILVHMSC